MSDNVPFVKQPLPIRRYTLFIAFLGVLATVAGVSAIDPTKTSPVVLGVAILAALVVELIPIKELFPQILGEVTLTESVHLATIVLFGYGFSTVVGVASCFVAEIQSRRPWYKVLFNISCYAATICSSGLVYLLLLNFMRPGRFAFPVAFTGSVIAYRLVSVLLTAILMALRLRESFWKPFISELTVDYILFAASVLIGLAAVYLYNMDNVYALIMLVPIIALSVGYERARRYYHATNLAKNEFMRAAEVQRNFMPVAPIEIDDVDVAFRYVPFSEVSGDFFDIFRVENEVYFAIGDAMGKGIPAALMAATQHHSLRFLATRFNTAEILEYANQLVYERNLPDSFISMFCARYSADGGRLFWSNAGHPPPILYTKDGRCGHLESEGGVALGAEARTGYVERSVRFGQDDILILYTDGATEAHGEEHRQYGSERLNDVVGLHHDEDAETIATAIQRSVNEFSAGLSSDDLTIVVLKGKTPVGAGRRKRQPTAG